MRWFRRKPDPLVKLLLDARPAEFTVVYCPPGPVQITIDGQTFEGETLDEAAEKAQAVVGDRIKIRRFPRQAP